MAARLRTRLAELTHTWSMVVVAIGVFAILLLTVDGVYASAHGWLEFVAWACLIFFAIDWMLRLAGSSRFYADLASGNGLVDVAGVVAVPIALLAGVEPRSAWLFGLIWLLKLVPEVPGLRQLRRVIVLEARPLLSVLVLFLLVLMGASVVVYVVERPVQPATFGSLPATMWWAVATLTTTGYGDVVPVTLPGRLVAALVMIAGLGTFGLGVGILATGFATETRRDSFLKTWASVSKVPFFAALGPAAIADITHQLRTIDLPARAVIIRKGQAADCMYFIADGQVDVTLAGKTVRLESGAFFGEMALLDNQIRSADVTTTRVTRLLILDIVDFRVLMARHPGLSDLVSTEAKRRKSENG